MSSRASTVARASTTSAGLFGTTAASSASSAPQTSASSSASTGSEAADGPAPIVISQTPIFACTPASYNISGGLAPYTAFIIRSGDANATILHTLPYQAAAGVGSWGVDVQPGESLTFVAKGANNRTGYSSPVVVQTSNDLSCVPGQTAVAVSHPVNAGAIAGGVVGGVVGLALIALLAWAFIIKPARTAKSKEGGFYEEDSSEGAQSELKGPIGSYNIGSIDFRAPSVPPEAQERLPLPAYRPNASREAL